jgi:ABC-2 type transport system permease protein
VWLALAMLLSVIFRSAATAALIALAIWLLFSVFWPILTPFLATVFGGPQMGPFGPNLAYMQAEQIIDRISPNHLYTEAAQGLLFPTTRFFGPVLVIQVIGAIPGSPLPTWQSLLLIWPQMTGLIAVMIVIFAIAYVMFQRQEIRA